MNFLWALICALLVSIVFVGSFISFLKVPIIVILIGIIVLLASSSHKQTKPENKGSFGEKKS